MQPSDDEDRAEPRLARRSPFTFSDKLCPRCLKPLQAGSELGGWLVPQDYYCPACHYRGTVFLEKELPDTAGEK